MMMVVVVTHNNKYGDGNDETYANGDDYDWDDHNGNDEDSNYDDNNSTENVMHFVVPYFLDIVGHVFIVVRLDIQCPLMCVSILLSLLTKISCHIAIDQRLHNCQSLQAKQHQQTKRRAKLESQNVTHIPISSTMM